VPRACSRGPCPLARPAALSECLRASSAAGWTLRAISPSFSACRVMLWRSFFSVALTDDGCDLFSHQPCAPPPPPLLPHFSVVCSPGAIPKKANWGVLLPLQPLPDSVPCPQQQQRNQPCSQVAHPATIPAAPRRRRLVSLCLKR
jgi:hypothetical protein